MYNNSVPAARNISEINFSEHILDNGLHVILHKDNTNPIVSVDLWYHVGSKDEAPGKTGFAHLFEHMMFQGSKHVKNSEHFKFIQQAGGNLNGSTSHDRTNYFETLPSNNLELALWLESDRMGFLNVNKENFDNQREVVKEEKRQRNDNAPYGTKWFNLFSRAFNGEPYEWLPIGSMEDLDNATLDDAIRFYKRFYSPSNSVLVIAGDINTTEALEQVNKYFAGIESNPVDKKIFPPVKFNIGEIKETIYDTVQIPAVFIGYKVPGLTSAELPSIELMTSILGESKSSRLYSKIVYNENAAKSAGAFLWDNELGGLLVVSSMGYYNSNTDDIEKRITETTLEFINSPVGDEELEKAKNTLESDMIESMQTSIGKAENLALFKSYFNNTQMINTIFDKYSSVTKADIKKAASKYLLNDNRVILHYLNKNGKQD
jgi:predicted Zn-dependent peptidase